MFPVPITPILIAMFKPLFRFAKCLDFVAMNNVG